ncbi:conserved hypothetical protein [[Clostridium] ultunense Esp]|uniref:DUF2922 domain-containing protein n=1 Tax=[Clostridium] ultunense Esp TaxID=1288971 RepID=M1ZK16_9FIRM|nr:DUF2922 domain-containing protein [Schnuerera ultunensis]CCQ94667.1 conserved hypothetical protein [[Clostridium] ultunense Esp]SHD76626.1 conserved protein of unknown function [[Clostridium] ultunense Esp]
MEKSKLEMEFKDETGKKFTISIDDPREDLTEVEVRAAMDEIVNRNIFFTATGEIVAAEGARFITTTIEELAI